MVKLSCLLFSCLLVGGNLLAQVDSSRPVPAPPVPVEKTQDTTPVAPKPHVRHDSAHAARRDSTRVVRQVKKDTVAASVRIPGTVTASPVNTTPASIADSVHVSAAAPVTAPASVTAAAPLKKGPDDRTLWKMVLADNPLFNFSAKWVVESFEIHRPKSKDSLFYLLLGILFYFALVRIFFEKYFNNLMTLFFRVSLRQQQIREQVLQTPLPSLLLNLLFIITGGLYAAFLLHDSRVGEDMNFWILYLDCMAAVGVIYLGKFLVLKSCGWVFNISRATDLYIFIVFLVNKMLGIFLLPFLIIITFSGPTTREIFITISFAMILVLLGYRVLASFRPIRNEIKLTPFHFFLYLCAFEIAPLLLIYKVLLAYR